MSWIAEWRLMRRSSYRRARNLFDFVEPDQCSSIYISPVGIYADACRVPDSVFEKHKCDLWIPARLLIPLLSFSGRNINRGIRAYTTNFRFINVKIGSRVVTLVCFDEMVARVAISILFSRVISEEELFERARTVVELLLLKIFKGDVKTAEQLANELMQHVAKKIEGIRNFVKPLRHRQPPQQTQVAEEAEEVETEEVEPWLDFFSEF